MPPISALARLLRGPVADAYRALKKGGAETLYHVSKDPESVLAKGLKPQSIGEGISEERWKPAGTYFADKVGNLLTHFSPTTDRPMSPFAERTKDWLTGNLEKGWGASTEQSSPPIERIIRGVPKKDVKALEITQPDLKKMYEDWEMFDPQASWIRENYGDTDFHRLEKAWNKHLRNQGYDIVKLLDADEVPGLTEHIVLDPKKVQLFWRDQQR